MNTLNAIKQMDPIFRSLHETIVELVVAAGTLKQGFNLLLSEAAASGAGTISRRNRVNTTVGYK